jgi:hypothetical protein
MASRGKKMLQDSGVINYPHTSLFTQREIKQHTCRLCTRITSRCLKMWGSNNRLLNSRTTRLLSRQPKDTQNFKVGLAAFWYTKNPTTDRPKRNLLHFVECCTFVHVISSSTAKHNLWEICRILSRNNYLQAHAQTFYTNSFQFISIHLNTILYSCIEMVG